MDSSLECSVNKALEERKKNFTQNIRFLKKIDPSLAYKITLTDPEDLLFCQTENKELNLVRSFKNRHYYYHSTISARQEAQKWFQSLDLHLATVIFVYGIGLGYYYEAAKSWLKQHPHHMLIFLEEDLGVIHRLCETELGSHLLKDQQVHLFLLQDPSNDIPLFNELSWSYFECPSKMTCLKLYEKVSNENFQQLQQRLNFEFELKKTFVDEYLHYGVEFFRNFYPNLLELPHAFWGNGLFHHFSQVPAIICGAGPSLNKTIEYLPKLKNSALIFAGGSALNALLPKGVIPHFGVAIDPNKEQYSRIMITQPFHIPFFYRNRLFHEALTTMTGPRLYLTGSGGYQIAHWFEKNLKIEGEDLEEGHNVVNFSLQIAQALGCNPIILIGVDLAFTNQRFYAEGISTHLNLSEEELIKQETSNSQPLLRKDIHGKPVYTIWKWITEAKWITDFAKEHPTVTIINSTDGGLGFQGIPNIPFDEVINLHLTETKKEIESIDKIIHNYSLSHIQTKEIAENLQEFQMSLDYCIILLSRLMEETEQLIEYIQQGGSFPINLHLPSMAVHETELEQEVGYQYLLDTFGQVFDRIHNRDIQELQSRKRKLSEKKKAIKKLSLQKQRYIFLRDVAHVNRELILHTTSLH